MATHKPSDRWAWDGDADPTESALRLIAHPQFPAAARALAASTIDCGDRDPAMATIFKDAGRYVTAMWALYLHMGGGMTLPQLKQICAASGLASPGRARLLLQVLEHIDFVRPVAPRAGQRARAYMPTPAFLAAWRIHLAMVVNAAALIEPGIAILAERLAEPGMLETFLTIQASRLHRLASNTVEVPPYQRIFLHRYAGTQIIALLLASGKGPDFPPSEPLPIRLNLVAARFGVSHLHVRRMLQDAVQADQLEYRTNGTIILSDELRRNLGFLYAIQLAELIASATATLATFRPPE